MISYLLERMQCLRLPLVLVIPKNEKADFEFLQDLFPITLIPGPRDNVLARYCKAAERMNLHTLIRVTADNPFTSRKCLKTLLASHLKKGASISTHTNLPYGTGVEIIHAQDLLTTQKFPKKRFNQEHVTPLLHHHTEIFHVLKETPPKEYHHPDLRLTVDTIEDFQRFQTIITSLQKNNTPIPLLKIIQHKPFILNKHPLQTQKSNHYHR